MLIIKYQRKSYRTSRLV